MTVDWTPRAGAAPRTARILAHARTEAGLLLRNGEQVLLAVVIPVGLLVVGLLFGDRVGLDRQVFPASVLALAGASTSFTSLAITTGFERRYGVLERLAATPLTRADLVVGKALASGSIAVGQVVVLSLLALALGWRPAPTPTSVLAALATGCLAVIAFGSLALVVAGRLQAEVTLALANLVWLLLAAGGALVVPLAAYPTWAQPVIALLPSAALGEALRGAASGQSAWWTTAVACAWAVVAPVLARKAFRWTS